MTTQHVLVVLQLLSITLLCHSCLALNPRHVCLLDSYDTVRGPYFTALLDQLWEATGFLTPTGDGKIQRSMAVCTLEDNLEMAAVLRKHLFQDLEEFASIAPDDINCKILPLESYDPITLQQEMEQLHPSLIWVGGGNRSINAFELRYKLTTSGVGSYLRQAGGPGDGENGVLFVGEGSAALCVGDGMDVAHVRGDDPKGAPEPQFRGLGMLSGAKVSVVAFAGIDETVLEENTRTKTDYREGRIRPLASDQVYVWSQSTTQTASFVYSPKHRGIVDDWQTPDPLPPLIDGHDTQEGVPCVGEPSVDPSRSVQTVGDSEWREEEIC